MFIKKSSSKKESSHHKIKYTLISNYAYNDDLIHYFR